MVCVCVLWCARASELALGRAYAGTPRVRRQLFEGRHPALPPRADRSHRALRLRLRQGHAGEEAGDAGAPQEHVCQGDGRGRQVRLGRHGAVPRLVSEDGARRLGQRFRRGQRARNGRGGGDRVGELRGRHERLRHARRARRQPAQRAGDGDPQLRAGRADQGQQSRAEREEGRCGGPDGGLQDHQGGGGRHRGGALPQAAGKVQRQGHVRLPPDLQDQGADGGDAAADPRRRRRPGVLPVGDADPDGPRLHGQGRQGAAAGQHGAGLAGH